MTKGQTPKLHGDIVNMFINVRETCTQLPREGSCEEEILVKHKKSSLLKNMCILSPLGHLKLELHCNICKGLIVRIMMF